MKNIAKLVFAVAVLAAPCVVNSQQTGDPTVTQCPLDKNGVCLRIGNCVCLVGKPPKSPNPTPWLVVNR